MRQPDPLQPLLLTVIGLIIRRNANATVQCPVEKGDYTIVQTADLPKEIPPGESTDSLLTRP